jgi:hypothetical protein
LIAYSLLGIQLGGWTETMVEGEDTGKLMKNRIIF